MTDLIRDQDGQWVERTMMSADDWSEVLGNMSEEEFYEWMNK